MLWKNDLNVFARNFTKQVTRCGKLSKFDYTFNSYSCIKVNIFKFREPVFFFRRRTWYCDTDTSIAVMFSFGDGSSKCLQSSCFIYLKQKNCFSRFQVITCWKIWLVREQILWQKGVSSLHRFCFKAVSNLLTNIWLFNMTFVFTEERRRRKTQEDKFPEKKQKLTNSLHLLIS